MSKNDVLIVIPARLASLRLPGKPLADIAGKPMIVHVMERAAAAALGPVAVATDSEEIASAVAKAGGQAIFTRGDHQSGSDRVHEAAALLDPDGRYGVVVNVQGDFPTLRPEDIRAVTEPLNDPAVDIATLAGEIHDDEERLSPNVVKAIGSPVDPQAGAAPRRLRALYFTRATAPWGEGPLYHHVGIYAYRRAALDRFVALPPSPLEIRERLEQLRALEAGMRIDVTVIDRVPRGVDTAADLESARALLAGG